MEGVVRETSGSLHDCQNVVRTSGHSSHTLCPNRIRLIRIRLIHRTLNRTRLIRIHRIRIHHIHIHHIHIHHIHQNHHRRRINLRVGQIMLELVQASAPASGELREQHLEGVVLPPEDIDASAPQNVFSQERTSLAAMRK